MKKLLLFLLAVVIALFMVGCSLTSLLSPARNLIGTWKTSIPVTFYYQSDFCNGMNGVPETTAQASWTMTWVITKYNGDSNKVNISLNYSTSNYQTVQSSCNGGSDGYVPLVTPDGMVGTISSSSLNAVDDNNGITFKGNFTTHNITGTWNMWDCILYCTGTYTNTNALILNKQ